MQQLQDIAHCCVEEFGDHADKVDTARIRVQTAKELAHLRPLQARRELVRRSTPPDEQPTYRQIEWQRRQLTQEAQPSFLAVFLFGFAIAFSLASFFALQFVSSFWSCFFDRCPYQFVLFFVVFRLVPIARIPPQGFVSFPVSGFFSGFLCCVLFFVVCRLVPIARILPQGFVSFPVCGFFQASCVEDFPHFPRPSSENRWFYFLGIGGGGPSTLRFSPHRPWTSTTYIFYKITAKARHPPCSSMTAQRIFKYVKKVFEFLFLKIPSFSSRWRR